MNNERDIPMAEFDILSVDRINVFYGQSHVIYDASLFVKGGEILCLLGRNGVGKTTIVKTIMGILKPRSGEILFRNKRITAEPPLRISRMGISYAPEDKRLFLNLTVRENLEAVGAFRDGDESRWNVEKVFELFPRLRERESFKTKLLSGGEQQAVAIGRALMNNPELLLLDEPSQGLAPIVLKDIAESLKELREKGLSILMCEQNFRFAARLSDRACILDMGSVCYENAISELEKDESVLRTYLAV